MLITEGEFPYNHNEQQLPGVYVTLVVKYLNLGCLGLKCIVSFPSQLIEHK